MKKMIVVVGIVLVAAFVFKADCKSARPPQPQTLLEQTASFIAAQEGFRHLPYWDNKRWSSGYGTPAKHRWEYVSRTTAYERLLKHLTDEVMPIVNRYDLWPDNKKVALASLIYNVGSANYNKSRCKGHLDNGIFRLAIPEWLDFNRANGEFSAGLYNRRKAEIKLFLAD